MNFFPALSSSFLFLNSALCHFSSPIILILYSFAKMSKGMGNITPSTKTGEMTKSEEIKELNGLDSDIDHLKS